MNLKILAVAIFLSLLGWATPTKAQQSVEPQIAPIQQLPTSIEELKKPSQVRKLQRTIQQQQPLLYLFLQLQQPQSPDLQQQAEAQIRQILQQPPSLQQQLIQQQIRDGSKRQGAKSLSSKAQGVLISS